jgi:hypothetical protein
MFLTESQLDKIIENTATQLGWGKDVLNKLGVISRDKRQAIQNPPNDNHWTLPIPYYYDDNIRMLHSKEPSDRSQSISKLA